MRNVTSSEIEVFPHCDHSAVTLHFAFDKQCPRGPGYWKFNVALLEDKNFVEQLSTKIPSFIEQYQEVSDKGLLWELINFSKQQQRLLKMAFARKVTRLIESIQRMQWLKDEFS